MPSIVSEPLSDVRSCQIDSAISFQRLVMDSVLAMAVESAGLKDCSGQFHVGCGIVLVVCSIIRLQQSIVFSEKARHA